jgi:hypothetical protein
MPTHDRVTTKVKVQFWWEIYRTLVMTPELRTSLRLDGTWKRTLDYYLSWGNVIDTTYADWWDTHNGLFFEQTPVYIRGGIIGYSDPCGGVTFPIKRMSLEQINKMLEPFRLRESETSRARFTFTPGAQIRPSKYEDYVSFLKEVYAPNPNSRPMDLRKIAQKRFNKDEDIFKALRLDEHRVPGVNGYVSRYCSKVQRLCRSVAEGEFPGKD